MTADYRTSSLLSRRRVLRGGAALGAGLAGAALIGCGGTGGNKQGAPAGQVQQTGGGGTANRPERPGSPVVKGTPKKGGTLNLNATETYTQHDQHTAVSSSEWVAIGERALEMTEVEGKLRGNVVEKWEVVSPTQYILKIRPGIKMHNKPPWNGREFDAEDVAWNINRIAGNTAAAEGITKGAFQRASMLEGLGKVEAVDKHTVRVTMAQPVSTFFNGLAEGRNMLMPKEIVDVGFKDPHKFAGFNAYQVESIQPDQRESFTRFDNYYRPGEPHFDKMVQIVLPDRAAILAAFISKQLALITQPTAQEITTIKAARPDALFYTGSRTNWQYLMPQIEKVAAFKDFRVRKAMQLATNFQEIGDGFHGPGWTYAAAFHPAFPEAWSEDKVKTLPGYNPATKEKDIAEAKKMMTAAAHENGNGITFELMNKPKADNRENSLRFQAQMGKVFPNMKINLKAIGDTATFDKAQSGREFEMISNDNTMVPDIVLEGLARFHTKGSRNYGGFSDAESDAMLDKALVEVNYEARKEIMNTYQQNFMDKWQPLIIVYGTPSRVFVQPDIGGYDLIFGPWESRSPNKARHLYQV